MEGKFMIRTTPSSIPTVVYLTGEKQYGLWLCEEMNTGISVFLEDSNLAEFDYYMFKQLHYRYKIDQLPKTKEFLEKCLETLMSNKNNRPMNEIKYPVVKELGEAKTIGELKELIKNYPDETSFGFRNQPMQSLHEVKSDETVFVVFQ